jgi:hypothetical protein
MFSDHNFGAERGLDDRTFIVSIIPLTTKYYLIQENRTLLAQPICAVRLRGSVDWL